MQNFKVRCIFAVILLLIVRYVYAEILQPDPAWKEGKLKNNFSWQLLQTPQRPNDSIQFKLIIKTGSINENVGEKGYSFLIPKMALSYQNKEYMILKSQKDFFCKSCYNNIVFMVHAIVSYDYTIYSLSLPNNNHYLIKQALNCLSTLVKDIICTEEVLYYSLKDQNIPVTTMPLNIKDPVWRSRLKDSSMLGFDPGQNVSENVSLDDVKTFFKKWYTPDVMILYIVGNVDMRVLFNGIIQNFSSLKGKRLEPVSIAILASIKQKYICITKNYLLNEVITLIWDIDRFPIKDSNGLLRYWESNLARDIIYRSLQKTFNKKYIKNEVISSLICRMRYKKTSCNLTVSAPFEKIADVVDTMINELSNINKKGVTFELFNEIIKEKQIQLSQLFAIYARINTNLLINQRIISQQNDIIDISPEQYQRLRQQFLLSQTLWSLIIEIRSFLSREPVFVLVGPKEKKTLNAEDVYKKFINTLSLR